MIDVFTDASGISAVLIVVVLPFLIIAMGEVEERLRQRDSNLSRVVSILRLWGIPLLTAWVIALGLFGLPRDNLLVRVVGTGLVITLAAASLSVLRLLVAWWRSRPPEDDGRRRLPQLLLALPRLLVIIATGWVLLDTVWGVDLSAALTALGVTSLVISFALQDTLSGVASGLLLLSDAPFQPGDWIKAGDIEGRVVDINWRSSRIQSRNGDLLVVPNAQLASSTVVNFDQPTRLHRVVVPVQVAYLNPPTLAKDMLLDAARSTPGVLTSPAPQARVVQIDDPLMGYEVDLWVDDYTVAPKVASDFGSLVWYQSHRHDVPLPSPAYDLYVYDGIKSGEAGRADRAEIRRRLRRSPLLEQISEDDLDRLAGASRVARFAAGEIIVDLTGQNRDLYVLWEGSAKIAIETEEGLARDAVQLPEGEVFGLLGTLRSSYSPKVVAVRDCDVVIVGESAAGDVASRNSELAAALNRLVTMRGRRIERVVEQVATDAATTPDVSEIPVGDE